MPSTVREAFYLVWCEDGNPPTFKHDTLESATQEAERLARKNPGRTFVVLQAYSARCVDSMQRIDFAVELPF